MATASSYGSYNFEDRSCSKRIMLQPLQLSRWSHLRRLTEPFQKLQNATVTFDHCMLQDYLMIKKTNKHDIQDIYNMHLPRVHNLQSCSSEEKVKWASMIPYIVQHDKQVHVFLWLRCWLAHTSFDVMFSRSWNVMMLRSLALMRHSVRSRSVGLQIISQ